MCSPDRWRIEPAATARGSRWVRPKRAGTLRVIYVPDPAPRSVFVITAYELGEKARKALRRRQKPPSRKKP